MSASAKVAHDPRRGRDGTRAAEDVQRSDVATPARPEAKPSRAEPESLKQGRRKPQGRVELGGALPKVGAIGPKPSACASGENASSSSARQTPLSADGARAAVDEQERSDAAAPGQPGAPVAEAEEGAEDEVKAVAADATGDQKRREGGEAGGRERNRERPGSRNEFSFTSLFKNTWASLSSLSQQDEDEVSEAVAADEKVDLFKDDPHSPYAMTSEEEAARRVAELSKKNDEGHKMEVEENIDSAFGEDIIVKERDSAPREWMATLTLLVTLAKEIKVFTKLTQYGARLLTVAMMCENIGENVSDVVNVFDLYNRGELVYFGFSLGTIVSFGSVLSLRVSSCVRAVVLMGRWICFVFFFLSSLSSPLLSHCSTSSLLSILGSPLSPRTSPLPQTQTPNRRTVARGFGCLLLRLFHRPRPLGLHLRLHDNPSLCLGPSLHHRQGSA